MLVARDPDNPEVMVLAQMKKNLGPPMPSLNYQIKITSDEIPRIAWMGESAQTAGSLLAATAGDEEERGALAEAKEFLREELAEGKLTQKDVVRGAKAIGISEKTLRRAKAALGVKSEKDGFESAWCWELPVAPKSNRAPG